ncbi:MAG: hypothetical protein HY815_15645 [Candidatus Riflebacteria bacterium]|nr:hypothetical protein [Candidatus Riflebacteria bacterium]
MNHVPDLRSDLARRCRPGPRSGPVLLLCVALSLSWAPSLLAGPGSPQRRCCANLKTISGALEMWALDKNRRPADLFCDPEWLETLRKDGYLQQVPRCLGAFYHYGNLYFRGGPGLVERVLPGLYRVEIPMEGPLEYRLDRLGRPSCTAHGSFDEVNSLAALSCPWYLSRLDWAPLGVGLALLAAGAWAIRRARTP